MKREVLLFCGTGDSRAVAAQLVQCGFVVRTARDFDTAVRLLLERGPVAAVIATEEPEAICSCLRQLAELPLLVLTPEPDEELTVRALRAGADDVLHGPYSRRQLAIRIDALIRRSTRRRQPFRSAERLQVGDLVLDMDTRQAVKGGRPLRLRPTGFRILAALARRAGAVVSHRELLSEVWGYALPDSNDVIRPHVRHLRNQLAAAGGRPQQLLSQRGSGYRLA